jgi:nicotinate-nucleotide adenylyltransferase
VSALSESELWSGARIGLLGGTFDPPHRGHLLMAHSALATLGLDRVLFSVAPHPPHKRGEAVSEFQHRCAMVRIATGGAEGVAVTRIEEPHDPSFSVDFLRACHFRTSADLYFLVGADTLSELSGWKEPAEVVRLCTLVVFPRDHVPLSLEVPGEASLVVFEAPVIDVSSTDIRRRIRAGESGRDVLPPGVAEYIERHGLYRGAP